MEDHPMATRTLAEQLAADTPAESPILVTARKVADAKRALDEIAATCERANEAMRELEMKRKAAQRDVQVAMQQHEIALAYRG
jgi:hypothetical protein